MSSSPRTPRRWRACRPRGCWLRSRPATLASTPGQFNSPQGDWVGVSARVSVLVYNPSLISASQLPTRISQLASAQYQGKLALAPGETDFQPIVTAYQHALRHCGHADLAEEDWRQRGRAHLPR